MSQDNERAMVHKARLAIRRGENMQKKISRKGEKILGFIFFLIMLVAGLLLGTQSTLILERKASGTVDAVNAWRLNGSISLITRSVTNLREARIVKVRLSNQERRSSTNRDAFGMLSTPEELDLIGDNMIAYPYQEDFSLIQGFLDNKQNARRVIVHPVDIRRTVSSWVLLTFALASVVGWIITLVIGRDPLADMPDKVKPLPGNVGAILLLVFVGVTILFFMVGDKYFGPLATRKVDQLMASARINDGVGIERAVHSGVFVDVTDNQGITALMLAARSGAEHATEALIKAKASVDMRDISEDSALDMAINGGHEALALRLVEAGADIHSVNSNGRTPLYLAASGGNCSVLEKLIVLGGGVTKCDKQGWTPLIAAAASGRPDCVRGLLAAGADPSIALADGRRAIDLAANEAVRNVLVNLR